MDWPRAKNILIIAFLGINLLLGYRLWAGPGGPNASLYTITPQEVGEVSAQLRDRGVVLACEVPRRARPLALLVVQNQHTDVQQLADRFFGAGVTVDHEGDLSVARVGNETLAIDITGAMHYSRSGPASGDGVTPPGPAVDTARAVDVAREFWRGHGGMPAGLELDYQVPLGSGRYLVVFSQKTQGAWFFGSQAIAVVGSGGVEEAYAAWPQAVKPSGAARPILPATEALLRVLPLLTQDKGTVVVEVRVGYYSETYDAREWEAVPVWRLRLGSGEVVYVNAYTGAVEARWSPGQAPAGQAQSGQVHVGQGQEILNFPQKTNGRTR
ncbi:MAG TPA: hypothetical protein GX513_03495 [Firmicutes bacterium]|nr:hypothetical protein [Bacillota bacterium]